jgi:hypothetical protein
VRVLHLDSGREMRGGQFQALHLLETFSARGMRQLLLAPSGAPLHEAARRAGVETGILSWRAIRSAARDFDLVHCHDARTHTLAALSGVRFVVSRRVVFPIRRGALSRWKYARAERFLAISTAVECELLRAGIAASRIDVVPDGVHVPAVPGARTGAVVAIESDDPLKGNELVREAYPEVVFTRDLEGVLPTARVLVYITESEGLGSAALLAMAHGVPVVASRVGGLPEIVHDGQTGLLVRNQAGEIGRAIRRLLDEEALAARLAAAGRALVERRYTVAHLAESTLASYRKALE